MICESWGHLGSESLPGCTWQEMICESSWMITSPSALWLSTETGSLLCLSPTSPRRHAPLGFSSFEQGFPHSACYRCPSHLVNSESSFKNQDSSSSSFPDLLTPPTKGGLFLPSVPQTPHALITALIHTPPGHQEDCPAPTRLRTPQGPSLALCFVHFI